MGIQEEANEAYYNSDEKIITDQEFDLLADTGLEIQNFRNKTDHFQPMGSLKKIKTEDDFLKWKHGQIRATPKLDGNSIELVYDKGRLIQAITRGDGFIGNDVTDKIKHCNILYSAKTIAKHSVKCEALMPKQHQQDYEKNIRNVVSGTLNRKSIDKKELNKIDIVPFSEMNYFSVPKMTYEVLEVQFNKMKEYYEYEIDGLVLEMTLPYHEEKDPLLPANIIALKFNKEGVDAEVGEIEWNLGKYGRLTPVLILKDKVQIDGTMVGRISASNYGLLYAAGLGVGAKIQVIKSGDIIPFVSKVIEKSTYMTMPFCPNCTVENISISKNKVHAICENCKDDKLTHLQHIFSIFDLEYISDSTIESLYNKGYNSLSSIFNLTENQISSLDGFGSRKAKNIVSKLKSIKLTEAKVLKCAMVKGISNSQSEKLVNHFDNLETFFFTMWDVEVIGNIDSFGDILAETVYDNKDNFYKMYTLLVACGVTIIKEEKKMAANGEKILFTGKCEQYGRKELTKLLTDLGFTVVSSINKDTDILLTDDVNSNSSKTKKAQKHGTKIISYLDFFNQEGIDI